MKINKKISGKISVVSFLVAMSCVQVGYVYASAPRAFDSFEARPPIHTLNNAQISATPQGLRPANIKMAYALPATGGKGTIAIITVYQHPAIEYDLTVFSKQFALAECTVKNKCLEIHPVGTSTKTDSGWSLESALDTEWAHAIAPSSKILVVEAASTRGTDLMKAVDYARGRADVIAISMSWGGDEFNDETTLDKHFTLLKSSNPSLAFFASSGDDGAGASWPAVSPSVIAVGGTSLNIDLKTGHFISEKAWAGSGGGVSAFETEPSYQISYSISHAGNKRAIPDVSYAADPVYGFSVYHMENTSGKSATALAKGWYVVGGTSAGAPQWAAIHALGQSVSLAHLYRDKAGPVYATFFRDIISGKNGTCAYYCSARARYDYVTGLGSPLTDKF